MVQHRSALDMLEDAAGLSHPERALHVRIVPSTTALGVLSFHAP
jgi:hypothetical protein